jgi:hypothetical protein
MLPLYFTSVLKFPGMNIYGKIIIYFNTNRQAKLNFAFNLLLHNHLIKLHVLTKPDC